MDQLGALLIATHAARNVARTCRYEAPTVRADRAPAAQVIVGGGRPQGGRTAPGVLAEHAVELGVAAEAGLEGGGQRRGSPAGAVQSA